jgi:poly-beta-1,6-N-acetyl-D-glucosamine synthase
VKVVEKPGPSEDASTGQTAAATAPSYVLITPARNEAAFIEGTIKSVIAQTVRPLKWVIVSDGSSDGTDDIVKKYAAEHPWIELVRTPERAERHFAGKVHAFNAGYARVKNIDYDVIGNLDADITFEPNYFEYLLNKFAANTALGVAGTPFREGSFQYDYRFANVEHVSGACQLFRRSCFESIGGYVPLKVGGIDLVAVTTARMKGWHTRTFLDTTCLHHRKTQSGEHGNLGRTFKSGYHDYLMGVHPFWQFSSSIYQAARRPILVGGGFLLAGFVWAALTRAERPVSKDFVAFRHREQMLRLGQILRRFRPGLGRV